MREESGCLEVSWARKAVWMNPVLYIKEADLAISKLQLLGLSGNSQCLMNGLFHRDSTKEKKGLP